jgi:hypothetical protein
MPWTLERLMPTFDHREAHDRWLDAEPERVWDALWDLRVRDLEVTEALTRLRGGPRAWFGAREDQGDRRVMDSMAPKVLVADRPGELVLTDVAKYTATRPSHPDRADWTPEGFHEFAEPGWSKVAMNFRLSAERGGTRLATETRVVSTDTATRRAFTVYWIPVRVGSGMVRRDVLRAVGKAVK